MRTRGWMLGIVLIAASGVAARPAPADVLAIEGSTSVEIQEIVNGETTSHDEATESYPQTQDTLPLQVVVKLSDTEEEAAGAVAAQFEDPRTATGANPEEFAINLTLNSLSPRIRYTGRATSQELRRVQFTSAQLLPLIGGPSRVRGEVFLDGALAVFAVNDVTDLSAVTLTLHVTVVQESEGASPVTVFDGVLQVTGNPSGGLNVTASGDFPRARILDADLSAVDPQLGVFRVLVVPNLVLPYTYEATVNQPFNLRATVEVEAANAPAGVGVAAVLGTPIDTLQQVLTLTQGKSTAAKMIAALQQERANPTGTPVFADSARPQPLLSACGLLGLESLVGLLLLAGCRRPWRR